MPSRGGAERQPCSLRIITSRYLLKSRERKEGCSRKCCNAEIPAPGTNQPVCRFAHHLFFVMTLVMACLMTTPAFSISLRDRPAVTQTLSAGCGCHRLSFSPPTATGMALRRVTRTPLERHYCRRQHSEHDISRCFKPRRQLLGSKTLGPRCSIASSQRLRASRLAASLGFQARSCNAPNRSVGPTAHACS